MGEVGGFTVKHPPSGTPVKVFAPQTVLKCPVCQRIYEGFIGKCPLDDTPLVIENIIPPIEHLPPLNITVIRLPLRPTDLAPTSVLRMCEQCQYRYMRNSPKCPLCKRLNPEFGSTGIGRLGP